MEGTEWLSLTGKRIGDSQKTQTPSHGRVFPATNVVRQSVKHIVDRTLLSLCSQCDNAGKEEHNMANGSRRFHDVDEMRKPKVTDEGA